MAKYIEQCKKCFHLQVCAQVMKNQLFIREKMLKEESPKCEYFANAADATEVRHVKWIEDNELYKCSECGCLTDYRLSNFCPDCGAKMDGKVGADNA